MNVLIRLKLKKEQECKSIQNKTTKIKSQYLNKSWEYYYIQDKGFQEEIVFSSLIFPEEFRKIWFDRHTCWSICSPVHYCWAELGWARIHVRKDSSILTLKKTLENNYAKC